MLPLLGSRSSAWLKLASASCNRPSFFCTLPICAHQGGRHRAHSSFSSIFSENFTRHGSRSRKSARTRATRRRRTFCISLPPSHSLRSGEHIYVRSPRASIDARQHSATTFHHITLRSAHPPSSCQHVDSTTLTCRSHQSPQVSASHHTQCRV
jgi:hypothetical protein